MADETGEPRHRPQNSPGATRAGRGAPASRRRISRLAANTTPIAPTSAVTAASGTTRAVAQAKGDARHRPRQHDGQHPRSNACL